MEVIEVLEWDAEGRLPTVEIKPSRYKAALHFSCYALLSCMLLLAPVKGPNWVVGSLAGVAAMAYAVVMVGHRLMQLTSEGLVLRSSLGFTRTIAWQTIDRFALFDLHRVPTSWIWCFRIDAVSYAARLINIGNCWQSDPIFLHAYLTYYRAKVMGDEVTLGTVESSQMALLSGIHTNRMYFIIFIVLGVSAGLAFALVKLSHAVRGH